MGVSANDIARPTGRCAATGAAIEPGQAFVATLVETDDGLTRLDYSPAAWEKGARPEPPLLFVGSWRTVMPEHDVKPRMFIDDDALNDLFEQLGEATETRRLALRYVLALILIRKRLLRLEGSDGSTMLVRPKGVDLPPDRGGDGPPLVRVDDPGLDEQTLNEVTEQLGVVLGDEA